MDIGIDRLVRTIVSSPDDVGEGCDHILEKMAPSEGYTDDVALLAVKVLAPESQ